MRNIVLALSILIGFQVQAQHRCGAHHLHQQMLTSDPDYARKHQELETYTQKYVANYRPELMKNDEVLIPVVFHILYSNPSNTAENISDLRINEQMTTFNKDFNAENADTSLIPDAFKSLKGSLKIRFVLANRDPLGSPTTGIVRRQTSRTSFSLGNFTPEGQPMKFSSQGGSDVWDPRFYLNVWVCNLSGGVLGFASFPELAGTAYDGIVLNSRNTGSTGALSPFNRGRTGTHELGHWLNLRHIWGDDGNACTGSDMVDDTPNQAGASDGCPSFPRTDACTGTFPGVMFMNYMDYTNDACMYMFTQGQAARMQAILDGVRATFKDSKGYIAPLNNDMAASSIVVPVNPQCSNTFIPEARFQNFGGNIIGTFTANYQIGNNPVVSKIWNGTLNPSGVVTIKFDEAVTLDPGNYTIKFFTSAPNGSIDPDRSNDTITRAISVGNLEVVSPPVTQGFENPDFPNSGWIINNPDNKITWARTTRASKSGSASIFINNFDYDPTTLGTTFGQIDDLITPIIDLSDAQNAALSFSIAAAQFTDLSITNNNWDTLQVLVSTDCGLTFSKVYEKAKNSLVTTTLPTTVSFTPNASQWRTDNISLTAFAGKENVQILFRNISHWENNIYIDDINVVKTTATGISTQNLLEGIEIFPNPSSGSVIVRIREVPEGLVSIEWMNTIGQTVLPTSLITTESYQQSFDLSSLPPGLYLARFIFEDGRQAAQKVMLR
jgi:hypothetical protein